MKVLLRHTEKKFLDFSLVLRKSKRKTLGELMQNIFSHFKMKIKKKKNENHTEYLLVNVHVQNV